MITCRKFSLHISEYIDGELTHEVSEEIREHIEYCPKCKKIHQSYSRLITFCHHCCSIDVPNQAHNELWEVLSNAIASSELTPEKPKSKRIRKNRK